MPEAVLRVAALVLALSFAWAALAKMLSWSRWRSTLSAYEFEGGFAGMLAIAVPAAEAMIPVLFLAAAAHTAAVLVLVLLAGFSLAVLRARRLRGTRLACGCFGGSKERDYRVLLARNALLGVAAAVSLRAEHEVLGLRVLGAPSAGDLLPLALTVIGIAAIAALFAMAARHL